MATPHPAEAQALAQTQALAQAQALPNPSEFDLRRHLGIPDDAEQVLILTETSHWDPNWMLTSEAYFRLRVRRTLRQAIRELLADPTRIYSVECVFFLRMFYERVPEHRRHVRDLVNAGRLRLMGSGVTTPDTIVPPTEMLIRDYLLGQEWLRENGMTIEPDVAFFPDTFGFSPGLPEVLRAVGVERAAICRIDGMYFFGNETELPGKFPRPGSSAERLLHDEKTLDFVWRGPDGAELLCHWLAFTYGQGDMLAHTGISRQAGIQLAIPSRDPKHIARRIAKYVAQLAPVSRTPYLLCPIGFDFTSPIPRLGELIDRHNQDAVERTGTWVVNAGLDDYLALLEHHRTNLPVIDLDPSQYYTGFFTSRPTLKRRYTEVADALLRAERLTLAADIPAHIAEDARRRLEPAWWTLATANHHDYVTGTSPDRVVRKEQQPWLDNALEATERVLTNLMSTGNGTPRPDTKAAGGTPSAPVTSTARRSRSASSVAPRRDGPLLTVTTNSMRLVFDEQQGGALTSATSLDGEVLLADAPSFDVVAYEDSGGLWRMGHEFAGGRFRPVDRLSNRHADPAFEVTDDGTIEVHTSSTLDGYPLERTIRIDPEHPVIHCRIDVTLADRRSATCVFSLLHPADHLHTDVPGGVVTRSARRWFDPTFWSVQSFAHIPQPGWSSAALLALPGALALRSTAGTHVAEVVVARNAKGETAYGFLPLPAQPARGHDPGPHRFDVAWMFTKSPDWRKAGVAAHAVRFSHHTRTDPSDLAAVARAEGVFTLDRDDVAILAAKPAHRGEGAIVRLSSTALGPVPVRLRWSDVTLDRAVRCDGRERDTDATGVDVDSDCVTLDITPGVTSIRLIPRR